MSIFYYSVVTIYPDHISTFEVEMMNKALVEFNYRKAMITELDDASITVRLLRISPDRILDITPGRED